MCQTWCVLCLKVCHDQHGQLHQDLIHLHQYLARQLRYLVFKVVLMVVYYTAIAGAMRLPSRTKLGQGSNLLIEQK